MSKPILICIVGESGTGKTTIAEIIEKDYDIHMIPSWTDRLPRYEGENSHTFISKEEFDGIDRDDMIAYTEFGDNRYCCLKSDVRPINTYVIDERGIEYLVKNFMDDYQIISLRVKRDINKRKEYVDEERIKRDENMFYLPDAFYDHVLANDYDTIKELKEYIEGYMLTESLVQEFPMFYFIIDSELDSCVIKEILMHIYKKYVDTAPNTTYTTNTLNIFKDFKDFGSKNKFITRMNEFVIKNDDKLKGIFDRNENDEKYCFINKPEVLLLFYLIDKNQFDAFDFVMLYLDYFADNDLTIMMLMWGLPRDEVMFFKFLSCMKFMRSKQ